MACAWHGAGQVVGPSAWVGMFSPCGDFTCILVSREPVTTPSMPGCALQFPYRIRLNSQDQLLPFLTTRGQYSDDMCTMANSILASSWVSVGLLVVLWMAHKGSLAKECTNIPRDNVSHTMRAFMLKQQVLQDANSSTTHCAIQLVAGTDEKRLCSFKAIAQELRQTKSEGMDKYRTSLRSAHSENTSFLKEVPLRRVRLATDSPQERAQATNLRYLLMLDVNNLIWNFRATAGISGPGSPYGGWEDPNSELRGHFVGHYLSASAMMWASTGNTVLLEKMNMLVTALGECQEAIGTGYLSAFPSTFFDRFEAIDRVWAPYYTMHKIMAGFLDQYTFAGNKRAFSILLWMAKYFLNRVEHVISTFTIERHWQSLNEETGGMNDIMYRLSMITGDPGHLKLAHLFDKPCFLGLLALQTDGLSGFHANTHIPIVVGSQMRYEATGDILYRDIAKYFLSVVNSSHTFATGGTSHTEFWQDPNRIGSSLERENQETCTTYNMLKVARNLFRWTRDVSYAEYYERLVLNGILGIQRGEDPGVMIYMLPQGPGTSKAVSYHGWGTPFDSFWCCYGTGIESFSKLGDSVYFEDSEATLYVAQFVSSSLSLDAAGLLLRQKVQELSANDSFMHVIFEFAKAGQVQSKQCCQTTLNFKVRIPAWTAAHDIRISSSKGGAMKAQTDGGYLSMSSTWNSGDALSLDFPVALRLEQIKDDRHDYFSLHAVFFGPYLLAGMTGQNWELGAVNISSPSSWISPVPESYGRNLYTFTQAWASAWPKAKTDRESTREDDLLVMGHRDGSITMSSVLARGTNQAAQSTFRLAPALVGSISFLTEVWTGLVSLELYSQPGRFLSHSGPESQISVAHWFGDDDAQSNAGQYRQEDAVFRLLPGLSGKTNTVSFEAASIPGCFLGTCLDSGGSCIKLRCGATEHDDSFNLSTSFAANQGFAQYHPISFIAKGPENQFLLFPLFAYKDESYTTYFDMS